MSGYGESRPADSRHAQVARTPQDIHRDTNSASAASSNYDAYGTPSITSKAASLHISSPSAGEPTSRGMDYYNGDLDVHMEDAEDPYNKQKYEKYARTPNSQRPASQYLPAEALEASTRMNTSPTSPYVSSPQQQQMASNHYAYTPQQSARQSPSRQNPYMSPTQQQRYYASPPSSSRTQASQLPPIQSNMSPNSYYPQSATQQLNAVFGNDTQSPKVMQQQQMTPVAKSGVPQFSKCHNVAELEPRINVQPLFRRANPEGGFISPLQALTTHLPATYRICNPTFQYESSRNPRRVLTKPSKGVKNDGYDNEDSDYILYVNDILGSEETNHKNRYLILDVLGQGTFGQVVKCQNLKTQEVVAVKVVKNKTAYFNQSMMEVSVLDLLNGRMDKNDDHHILRLKDTFIHRQHLCLVFELLSVNLYELIKQNQFRGLSTTLVRVFAQQLLNGLCLLSKAKLIHCDLKPENILLKKSVFSHVVGI
jgi:dual specificity protein kinase YAK1